MIRNGAIYAIIEHWYFLDVIESNVDINASWFLVFENLDIYQDIN